MRKIIVALGILTISSLVALTATSFALVQKSNEVNSLELELWKKEKVQLALVDAIVMAAREAKLGGYTRISFKGVSEVTIHWENDDPQTGNARIVQVRAECPEHPSYYICDWRSSPVETTFLVDD